MCMSMLAARWALERGSDSDWLAGVAEYLDGPGLHGKLSLVDANGDSAGDEAGCCCGDRNAPGDASKAGEGEGFGDEAGPGGEAEPGARRAEGGG